MGQIQAIFWNLFYFTVAILEIYNTLFWIAEMWMEYPGGNLRFASYNKTDQISDYSKGYVLPLTYFGNVLNISAIEFLGEFC